MRNSQLLEHSEDTHINQWGSLSYIDVFPGVPKHNSNIKDRWSQITISNIIMMNNFEILQELPNCDIETGSEQVLWEKWGWWTCLAQGHYKPSTGKKCSIWAAKWRTQWNMPLCVYTHIHMHIRNIYGHIYLYYSNTEKDRDIQHKFSVSLHLCMCVCVHPNKNLYKGIETEWKRQTKTEYRILVACKLSIALLSIKITQILLEKAVCPTKKQQPHDICSVPCKPNGYISNCWPAKGRYYCGMEPPGKPIKIRADQVGKPVCSLLFPFCLSAALMLYLKRISQLAILKRQIHAKDG